MADMLQHTSATPREFRLTLLKKITNNFCKDSEIGRGGYGIVYKGVLDNGDEIAVKKLHNQPGIDSEQFKNELLNLMRVQHQNIIRLVGYCSEARDNVIEYNGKLVVASVEDRALCFEYMKGGTLGEFLADESGGLREERYRIIRGICEGLKHLHTGSEYPIYHLDLKPANILLDKDMTPKIGDFGLSRLFGSANTCVTKTFTGTRGYMPPEYIDGQEISPKFDVFSLGVIILQVIAGQERYYTCPDMPPEEFTDLVIENWDKRMKTEEVAWGKAVAELRACIQIGLRCIEAKRVRRPTITEVVEELDKINDMRFFYTKGLWRSEATG